MHAIRLATVAALAAAALTPLAASADQQQFKATLTAMAVVPAATFVEPPEDAPDSLRISGKYTAPDHRRVDALGKIIGLDGIRPTGINLPFVGQPFQGLSGIKQMPDGTFWTLTDNGYGAKNNSADAALMLHHIRVNWDKGTVDQIANVFLTDPDKKVWFPIVNEGTKQRYLTGADFDIESIQPVADGFWIGDEFGPFLIKVDLTGKVVAMFDAVVDGKVVMSPDNPAVSLPASYTAKMPFFSDTRSKGFEGMARSADGTKLYALLEGPLTKADSAIETVDGHPALRIVEFDIASQKWTGRSWFYPFEDGSVSIGDFNMIDATTGLVIERDNGEGTADKACPDPTKPQPNCFEAPAKEKRIYKIEMSDANVGQSVRKIGYIDLLAIADPNHKRLQGGSGDAYNMPFVTIENVDVVDPTHIIVANDNNFPFSAGRDPNKPDDNEFVLLEVGDFLKAK